MFISDTHLPQLLPTDCYRKPEAFRGELEQLLLPGWHCIGNTSDLARVGDFFTFDLFGRPLLVRRGNGGVETFLNVCVHRSGLLASQKQGQLPQLKCQNHGWIYDDQGKLQEIPNTDVSRTIGQECPALRRYRTELLGQLIFVTLDEDAVPLAEYLRECHDEVLPWYTENWTLIASRLRVDHVNWKLFVENSLESYHIDTVHPRTFGRYPAEEACIHELKESGTGFGTTRTGVGWWEQQLNKWIHRLASEPMEHYAFYTWHHYPNLMFTKMGVFSWIECVLPVTASKTHTVLCLFAAGGARGRHWGKLVARILKWKLPFFEQVAAEDSAALPAVQRGLDSPSRAGPGLISKREERIFHFQRYVQRLTVSTDTTFDSAPT